MELMGDEKETWKVKTLDEILQEKKRRRELEEKSDPKRSKNVRESPFITSSLSHKPYPSYTSSTLRVNH